MGEVFEAVHTVSRRRVALKVLFPNVVKDEASRQRFLREASASATIGHEGIVEVFDAGIDPADGAPFVAMEFLEGETVRDRLERGRLPLPTVIALFRAIVAPMAAAHARNIVHRDLKPDNVFLVRKGNAESVKILDFGIAREMDTEQSATKTGTSMGTPHYMAPEQAMSARGVNAAADVWSLGAMLYEAISGEPPFEGETTSAIIVYACTRPHRPLLEVAPSTPKSLAELVDKCLAKEPQNRPKDAGALAAALDAIDIEMGLGLAPTGAMPAVTVEAVRMHAPSHPTPQPGPVTPPPTQPGFGPGQQGFGTAQPGFATPQPGFATPQPGFATSQPAFGAPQPAFGGAQGNFAQAGQYTDPSAMPAGPPSNPRRTGLYIGLAVGLSALLLAGCCVVGALMMDDEDAVATPGTPGTPADTALVRESGSLATGDQTLSSGEFRDAYPTTFAVGQRVRVRVTSTTFDPYVIMRAPSGKQLENDDVSATDTNVSLDIDVTEAGQWTALVTSKRPGESGAYELVIENR